MTPVAGRRWLALLLLACVPAAQAVFNAGVSPPRFELSARPGETLREILSLYNAGTTPETYLIRSADWDLNRDGSVTIHPPELQPGSCRPWARIERREIILAPQLTKNFRFEIAVPADAPAGECRLALLVEAKPPQLQSDTVDPGFSLRLPIAARLAVIVYVVIGDARPELVVEDAAMREVRGEWLPVLAVRNDGKAHGRAVGFVTAEDDRGQRFDAVIVEAPILPGAVADVLVRPDRQLYGDAPPQWQPPLRLRGTLETESGDIPLDLLVR